VCTGPIHDVIAEPEDLTTEAGHELQPITWRVVDQWKHVIESTKGRIVLLENPELYAVLACQDCFAACTHARTHARTH
jgi:hypothetical protein